jgi:hypothetical protein
MLQLWNWVCKLILHVLILLFKEKAPFAKKFVSMTKLLNKLSVLNIFIIIVHMKMKRILPKQKSKLHQREGNNKPSVQTQFGSETYKN